MKVRCIDNKNSMLEIGKVYKVIANSERYYKIEYKPDCTGGAQKYRFEEVNEDDVDLAKMIVDECVKEMELREKNKMEKTFREVIRDIKEGEVWECTRKDARIKRIRLDGILVFDYGHLITEDRSAIRSTDKFKLQRKEYTFEEAFKAYEEGKEIESCEKVSYKKIDENSYLMNGVKYDSEDTMLSINEIRGKWYIND